MATTFSHPVSSVTIGDWDLIRSSWPFYRLCTWAGIPVEIEVFNLFSGLIPQPDQQETGSDSTWFHSQLHRENKEKDSKTDREFGGVEER
jgi:hypothetical protein